MKLEEISRQLGNLRFEGEFKGLGNPKIKYMRCMNGVWGWIEAGMRFEVFGANYRSLVMTAGLISKVGV